MCLAGKSFFSDDLVDFEPIGYGSLNMHILHQDPDPKHYFNKRCKSFFSDTNGEIGRL